MVGCVVWTGEQEPGHEGVAGWTEEFALGPGGRRELGETRCVIMMFAFW